MRTRGVDVDAQAITGALDLHPAHRGALELAPQVGRGLQSSIRNSRYSFLGAIHRDFHSVVMPSRNPYGLTF